MTNPIIHVGDVGTAFELTIIEPELHPLTNLPIPIDVSGATTKKLYFKKPKNTKFNKTANFTTDGKDGKIRYISVAGDVDTPGSWEVQGYVELSSGGKFYSEVVSFGVRDNIAT